MCFVQSNNFKKERPPLSSGKISRIIFLPNETWQHSSVQFSILAEESGRGWGQLRDVKAVGWECECPFGPSFWPLSQSNECECKGSHGLQRAKHCLNDVITIHLFPLNLSHLGTALLFIAHTLSLFLSFALQLLWEHLLKLSPCMGFYSAQA